MAEGVTVVTAPAVTVLVSSTPTTSAPAAVTLAVMAALSALSHEACRSIRPRTTSTATERFRAASKRGTSAVTPWSGALRDSWVTWPTVLAGTSTIVGSTGSGLGDGEGLALAGGDEAPPPLG